MLLVAGSCGLVAQDTPAPAYVPNVAESFLLAAANQDRAARLLPLIHFDASLALAARLHAQEMAKRETISHRFDGEEDLATRAAEAGAHFSLITENVAEAPNSAEIHDLWMHSAGHRANLLDPKVDAVGIAVLRSHGEYFAVEDFAHTVARLSLGEQESRVGVLLADLGLKTDAEALADARQTCQMATGFVGARKPWFVMRYTASDLGRLPDQLAERIASGKYHAAVVGACLPRDEAGFTHYSVAVLLFP